jgi:hypothetical protein
MQLSAQVPFPITNNQNKKSQNVAHWFTDLHFLFDPPTQSLHFSFQIKKVREEWRKDQEHRAPERPAVCWDYVNLSPTFTK